jgi:predicted nucleic-acid-binding protein
MIAVDTNILVRYAVKDERRQTIAATDFLGTHQCFVLKTVLLELVWVLSSSSGYGLSRDNTVERVRHILGLPTIAVQDPDHVARAITWYSGGMDFADALHLSSSCELKAFATFEKKIAKQAAKFGIELDVILVAD